VGGSRCGDDGGVPGVRLRLVVRGVSPVIVRVIEVPAGVSLALLHRVLLACFGWSGECLHVFDIRGRSFSDSDYVDAERSTDVTVGSCGLRVGERFCWRYDSARTGSSTPASKLSPTSTLFVWCWVAALVRLSGWAARNGLLCGRTRTRQPTRQRHQPMAPHHEARGGLTLPRKGASDRPPLLSWRQQAAGRTWIEV
jgi:Plasmid pRiA4b ORF-3-like protein